MRNHRSVVASQVNHVVCLSVSAVSTVSPFNYLAVQMLLFPIWRSENVLFFRLFCFLKVVLSAT